jgi:hypothetical protein
MAGEIVGDDNVAGTCSSARFVYRNDALEQNNYFLNKLIRLPLHPFSNFSGKG